MQREPIAYTIGEDDLGRPAYVPVFKEEKTGMRESSQSDALFASEIDLMMGTEWPTRAFIRLSSHGKVAAERKFETMDEIEAFEDVEAWIDEQARKHWPDSDYAKTFPVVAVKP